MPWPRLKMCPSQPPSARCGRPKLSSKEWFTKALPDHEKATFAIWVDAKAALGNIDEAGGYTEFLSSLRGWGTEFVPGAAGEGTWLERIVRA